MATDPWAEVYLAALEYCGSRVTAPEHLGEPILVSTFQKTLVYPPCVIKPGMPVVDLIVQSDGVWIVSCRRGMNVALSSSFHRFPTLFGEPFLAGQQGAEWRESVDIDLTVALDQLRQLGLSGTASP